MFRNIYKNVIFGLEIRKINTPENRNYVEQLLKKYHLYEFKDKYPSELSGGEQQRVSIGRALMNKPSILLADEPTGNLDSTASKEIVDIFKYYNKTYKQTILLVTHDERIALQADRIMTLKDGKIVSDEKNTGAR